MKNSYLSIDLMNKLNELLNNVFLPKPPIEWDCKAKRWKVSSSFSSKLYIPFSILWKCILMTFVIVGAIALKLKQPDGEFSKLLVCTVLLQVVWGTLFIDLVCLWNKYEIVECCNMYYKYESRELTINRGGNPNIF